MGSRLLLYSDGGARGNPGPSAIAFLALSEHGEPIKTFSRFIGTHTNNQAEYEALIVAMEFAIALKVDEVFCHLDSELVVKQLNGEYSVKNFELKKLWCKVKELKNCFKKIRFLSVPRTDPQIVIVDALVNKTLDQKERENL